MRARSWPGPSSHARRREGEMHAPWPCRRRLPGFTHWNDELPTRARFPAPATFQSLGDLMPSTGFQACPLRAQVDPRLLRFSAGATASVLAVALLIAPLARPLPLGMLASQVAVFAFTAFVSFQWSLCAQIFARVIWPRIGPPTNLEDARPHRFGQFIGFLFTAPALISFMLGADAAGL